MSIRNEGRKPKTPLGIVVSWTESLNVIPLCPQTSKSPLSCGVTVQSQSSQAGLPLAVFTLGAAESDSHWPGLQMIRSRIGNPSFLRGCYLLARFEKIVQVEDFIKISQPLPGELV